MQKFKKYAKKYGQKVMITFLVSVFLCISCFIPSSAEQVDYISNVSFSSLSDIFTGVSSGDLVYDDVNTPPSGLTSPYLHTVSPPAGTFTVVGNFNLNGIFNPNNYYTLSIPLSASYTGLSIAFVYLSLFDNKGVEYTFKSQAVPRPDSLSSNIFATYIFTLNVSGRNLQEISKFKITVKGNQWGGNYPLQNVYIGLLKGRYINISSMTEYEYNSLYGNGDYDIDTGDSIARVDAIENELFDRADLGSITESVFGSLTWFADISPGIMSAGMIVDELLNFGGINNTWMLNVVRFALMLGVLALFLAIGPGVISKFSSSDRKEGYIKRRKGDDG